MTLASGPRYQHVGIGNAKISRRVPKPTQKTRVGCPPPGEYTYFLALGNARTGSLRLLPFCSRHLTYFCWQPIRAQAEGTWHWRPYWQESTRPGRWRPRSTFGLTRRRTGLWTFLKITSLFLIFLRISRQFEGATCKYCIIAQALVM